MTENDILQQGEMAKYIVDFTPRPLFDPETMDFTLEVHYGMNGQKVVIPKAQFLEGTNGQWLFMIDTTKMIGRITARLLMQFEDSDFASGVRQEVDEQVIAFVVGNVCPKFIQCPACTGTTNVTYTRTEESGLASLYMRLVSTETNGTARPFITSNNMYIFALRNQRNNN